MMVRFYSYFFFLSFSSSFHVGSYTLTDGENNLPDNEIWETKGVQTAQHGLDINHKYQRDWSNFGNENQIPKFDTLTEDNGGKGRWSSIVTFDRLKNLTEKDNGPGNNTKVIFINSEDRLTIYENDYDDAEDKTGIQDRAGQRLGLFSPEGFLSRIHSSEENSLERSKRQADGGKKKCRCRKKGRRVVRRRRRRRGRRRRVGQARQGIRRRRGRRRGAGRRRRGKRRCVCGKKKGDEGDEGGEGGEAGEGEEDGESKGDEEPEIEEADGEEETTTTEGGEESENEEEGKEVDEGNGDEGGDETMGDGDKEEDEEGDKGKEEENEDSQDEESLESEDESDEKGRSEERSEKNLNKNKVPMSGINHNVPVYVMYPGTQGAYGAAPNAAGTTAYTTLPVPFSPYPYYMGNKK